MHRAGGGRKTAARLLIELKSRLDLPDLSLDPPGAGRTATDARASRTSRAEARAALSELGYAPDEIRGALDGLRDDVGVEEMLRLALRELARHGEPEGPPRGPGRTSMRLLRRPSGAGDADDDRAGPVVDPAARRPTRRSRRSGCGPGRWPSSSGRPQLVEHLSIVLQAARQRRQPVDHLLFAGPPGLGKTSLAGIVATEMGAGFRITAGPVLTRAGDLAALLTDLQDGDVLFIDEIHRLHRSVEEMLYSAMEDGRLDILIGKGPTARSIRLDLPHFTLVGATTRTGLVSGPLRDRFGFVGRLDLYAPADLRAIVERSARILKVEIDSEGAIRISERSRGTPRVANRLLRRVRDFAEVRGDGVHRRGHRQRGPRAFRRRRIGPRQGRPFDPGHAVRPFRRPAGRVDDAGTVRRGRDRHDRGRLRALPAAERADPTDGARTCGDKEGLGALGSCRARVGARRNEYAAALLTKARRRSARARAPRVLCIFCARHAPMRYLSICTTRREAR